MTSKFRRQYLRSVERTKDYSFVVTRPLVTTAPHLSTDRRRPLCDDHVESSREAS